MKAKRVKFTRNMTFNVVGTIILLLIIFSLVASLIGYAVFTDSFTKEYTDSSTKVAKTATKLVNGDNIDKYLNGEEVAEHNQAQGYLDYLCNEMDVVIIYVIKVDTSDYGHFVSVFNSVNQNNTIYTPWPIGYERETTNDEYRKIYQNIYEQKVESAVIFRTTNLNGAIPHITSLVPIKNSLNEVVSILCVQTEMEILVQSRVHYTTNVVAFTVILIVVSTVAYVLYFKFQYVNPLKKVKNEAERFAKDNNEPQNHLNSKISRINEISSLATSIDQMECKTLEYIENIKNITAEKERIGTELKIASVIQESSLNAHIPERNDIEIFATMTPAKEVGGDFYDYFMIDDDHVGIVVADVSGKGVPAALFMMVTKILISEKAKMGASPAEVLEFVNDRICANNKADMFVTVWLGILEISTGKLTAANAGHNHPGIYRKESDTYEIVKSKHGVIVGAMSGTKYANFEIQLKKGDKIFLYTDGVTESKNIDGKMFAETGMINALNECKDLSPRETLEFMKTELDKFAKHAEQFDDITMLCCELKGVDMDKQSLILDAKVENLQKVLSFVNNHLESQKCPVNIQKQIDLSVEELFVNTAHYAYDDVGKVQININNENHIVNIELIDSGKKFNPLENKTPDTTLSASDRNIGGLGIFLVKKNMDNVEYKYENSKNILKISKKIK